ncbi:class I SAM-dependent methyltransferase [Marinicella meishanensis]|uniref:class I SAM-dependent methyltransferase n=1 Tax=Marinicella meishanensis TaxID=2873263 RepID=UPI001CC1A50D|nr:class I SAM-dependent methyltransferase [Marinicella sp. NBU2979]
MLATEPTTYQDRIDNEINFYKDCEQVHQLPDIFHYWSNRYLLPKFQPHGFNSPDDFFIQQVLQHLSQHPTQDPFQLLSIGAGNGESELLLADALVKQGIRHFTITCLDINPHMLQRCQENAAAKGLGAQIATECGDFNVWEANQTFDVVLANQCLHHVINLEHLLATVELALKPTGVFLVSDMIGRNGHQRWPEALTLLKPIWEGMPDRLKHNRLLQRFEPEYINHDCSTSGFEGIRAQDILPMLVERFHFDMFIPFANLIMVLIDRPFGHNFQVDDPADLALIDRVHEIDEQAILKGTIKPTQMVACLSKQPKHTVLTRPELTPEFCIRWP